MVGFFSLITTPEPKAPYGSTLTNGKTDPATLPDRGRNEERNGNLRLIYDLRNRSIVPLGFRTAWGTADATKRIRSQVSRNCRVG